VYIVVTHVDADTKIPCTEAPMRTGPWYPDVKNLKLYWYNSTEWPINIDPNTGAYSKPPRYYGTCDDDANINIPGVLGVLTVDEYRSLRNQEFYRRKPYPSWVGNENTMFWSAPIPHPVDGYAYGWDETIVNWVKLPTQPGSEV